MRRTPISRRRGAMALWIWCALLGAACLEAQVLTIDLADLGPDDPDLRRIRGSVGNGRSGVPVAGGLDVDGDGFADAAFSAFRAAPGSPARTLAGEIFLVFGDGTFGGEIDTAASPPEVLRIWGGQTNETAGSEIWIDDVTGDGLGDLLVCRQNYEGPASRVGAGAVSIVVGGPALRTLAQMGDPLDLGAPATGITVTTIAGATAGERFGIWVRTGDVTGDGVVEMLVGADQRDRATLNHTGAAYLIRGGAHLADGGLVDLGDFGMPAPGFPWAGQVARIDGPIENEAHFGSTVQIGDLDGNGFGEVLVPGRALNRAGAGIPTGHASDSQTGPGTLYIFWDDIFQVAAPGASGPLRPWHATEMTDSGGTVAALAFTDPWPDDFVVDGGMTSAGRTVVDGGPADSAFGEEILGGEDYDGDGLPDLFVGDLTGFSDNGFNSGLGYVLFDAPSLRGRGRFGMDPFGTTPPPMDLVYTVIHGPEPGAIAADTAMHGDFDGDGIADLALSSPHATPLGRLDAGTLHVLLGQRDPWPAEVDLAPGMLPPAEELRIAEIYGALATTSPLTDIGDVIAYSGDAGDLDGDGLPDLIFNEMAGNGVAPGTLDVGNLLLLSGQIVSRLFRDGFESGDLSRWTAP